MAVKNYKWKWILADEYARLRWWWAQRPRWKDYADPNYKWKWIPYPGDKC